MNNDEIKTKSCDLHKLLLDFFQSKDITVDSDECLFLLFLSFTHIAYEKEKSKKEFRDFCNFMSDSFDAMIDAMEIEDEKNI